MNVVPISCLKDNYAYLILCPTTGDAAVVDPSEARPVLRALQEVGANLVAVLNTHHHWDHVGGNAELLNHYPHLAVYGHASDRGRIPGQTVFLNEGDTVPVGDLRGGLTHNPGHTTGAITYYFEDAAFTGDTLFAAGCGRLFEGGPRDMYASLHHKIGARASDTRLFFGHEYTENNLRFAATVEPDNAAVADKLARVRALRAEGLPTTPTTLAEEWATNPFMRCESGEVRRAARAVDPHHGDDPVAVLGAVRKLKDAF